MCETFCTLFRTFRTLFGPFRTLFGSFRTLFDSFRTLFERFRTLFDSFRTLFERFRTLWESLRTLFGTFRTLWESFRTLFAAFAGWGVGHERVVYHSPMPFAAAFVAMLCLVLGGVLVVVTLRILVQRATRRWDRRDRTQPTALSRFSQPGCGRCGYPLTGWTTRVCPECGSDAEVSGIMPVDIEGRRISPLRRAWLPTTLSLLLAVLLAITLVLLGR